MSKYDDPKLANLEETAKAQKLRKMMVTKLNWNLPWKESKNWKRS